MPHPKILFLEVAAGGGHKSITTAIIQAIGLQNPQVKTIRFDPTPKIIHGGYQIISRQIQFIYTLVFRLTDTSQTRRFLTPLISSNNTQRIKQIIKEEHPDLIFTNTLFAIDQIPEILEELHLSIPFCVFVPDPFTAHAVYFTSEASQTFVASIAAFQTGLRLGIKESQLSLCGHPIRQEFFDVPSDLSKHKQSLDLKPDLFTITMGGSGDGAEKTYQIITELNKLSLPNFQIVFLTGNNTGLAKKLKNTVIKNIYFKILPSIDNVSDYLHASDLVAAKAGPNILFETIATGTPFIATHHVEGQENGNLDFIKSTQVGFIEENPKLAAELISYIVNNPSLLNHTHHGIKLINSQLKHAAPNIASHILEIIQSSQPDAIFHENL